MIIILLRILFGGGFLWVCGEAVANAQAAPLSGDLRNAYLLILCVLLALANAAVWAPFFGDSISAPITNLFTQDGSAHNPNRWQNLLYWLQDRGHRRLTVLVALFRGWLRPEQPAAFWVGFRNARPGTWTQSFFAQRVFGFDNAQHCLEAFKTLRKYGIDPRPHRNPEVNNVLFAYERQAKPEPARLPVTAASNPVPIKRNPRIKLAAAHDELETPPDPKHPT